MRAPPPALPPGAWAAGLAGLPAMGPARLRAVLSGWGPEEAWARVAAGRAGSSPEVAAACRAGLAELAARWRAAAAGVDLGELWRRCRRAEIAVVLPGDDGYPPALVDDPEAPAVLFVRGDPDATRGRRVAIVGARRCTAYGRGVARDLGRDLAAAGVGVVSGLALGVDGAAHEGALEAAGAPPIGVVGSGLDVVYPATHAALWRQVAEQGVLVGEAPPGARPEPWRFPARNRIIAGLAEVVVVVESTYQGGSRHTVDAAARRDRQVMAVPGSVRSPASAYPNDLLADGCHPARDALDVLVALGLSTAGGGPGPAGSAPDLRAVPGTDAGVVLDAAGWEAATLDDLCARTGWGPGRVSVALAALQEGGWVTERSGWWERRAAGPSPAPPRPVGPVP